MIFHDKSRFDGSMPYPTAQNHGITDGGMCLVAVADGAGGRAAAASKGVANEVYLGGSILDVAAPTRLVGVKAVSTAAAEQKQFISNYTSGSARVVRNDTGAAETTNVTVANDGTITVNASGTGNDVGTGYTITYSYAPTQGEVLALVGDWDRVSALDAGAEVGVALQGLFFVTNFDTTAAWAINDVPKTGPGGTYAKGGSGGDCVGVRVAALPKAGQPYLGLEIHVR